MRRRQKQRLGDLANWSLLGVASATVCVYFLPVASPLGKSGHGAGEILGSTRAAVAIGTDVRLPQIDLTGRSSPIGREFVLITQSCASCSGVGELFEKLAQVATTTFVIVFHGDVNAISLGPSRLPENVWVYADPQGRMVDQILLVRAPQWCMVDERRTVHSVLTSVDEVTELLGGSV